MSVPRDIITRLLSKWLERYYDAQDPVDDDQERDWWLDRHLMGVAMFLKQVGSESEDMELLGFAAKIEMVLAEQFERESRQQRASDEQREAAYRLEEQIRQITTARLKNPKFQVDLSRYREVVDAHRARLHDSKVIPRLEKYLDEKKHLKAVCAEAKRSFYGRRTVPSLDEVDQAFDRALQQFYARADKNVAIWLDCAVRRAGESVAPRLPAPSFLGDEDR
jgi:hypothetical protein